MIFGKARRNLYLMLMRIPVDRRKMMRKGPQTWLSTLSRSAIRFSIVHTVKWKRGFCQGIEQELTSSRSK